MVLVQKHFHPLVVVVEKEEQQDTTGGGGGGGGVLSVGSQWRNNQGGTGGKPEKCNRWR
jgi:hypothetical protein